MTNREREEITKYWYLVNNDYSMTYYNQFDYSILSHINTIKSKGPKSNEKPSLNNCIMMIDTETSKLHPNAIVETPKGTKYLFVENYVVAWTLSIRVNGLNIVTLYGGKPSELVESMELIHNSMKGGRSIFFCHNLSYDWTFIRKFTFECWLFPEKQLNTKSHYPILIQYNNGIELRDSLILSQRSLDKWAKDLNVDDQKAVGKWDYDKIRNQKDILKATADELEYIEHDTLAGVECIDALLQSLNKDLSTIPFTATGIPREQVRKLAYANHYKSRFDSMALSYNQYLKMLMVYHGGYTHANRHLVDVLITNIVRCYDFASSYPYTMVAYKFPMEAFTPIDITADEILEKSDDYAFMFKLTLVRPRLKDDWIPMPALQYSKCTHTINSINDNGRVLCADLIQIYLTEQDLAVIMNQYDYDEIYVTECEFALKDYLPRWFTDYVFKCFTDKTMLKGGDKVAYAIAKSVVNSLYGMCVQQNIKNNVNENYETGEYQEEKVDAEEEYKKYLNRKSSILPYQWGVWVTAYAFRNLFELGKCAGTWIYSDTDSCYGYDWNEDMIKTYNDECKKKLKANGYGAVVKDGREYWLGVAETSDEDVYTEFKALGAKRYCGRCQADGELHITVAGVPKKKGALCLDDDINNFTAGCIFSGEVTGKLTHIYNYVDEIRIDKSGNEIGDSIDLTPCDYLLDSVEMVDWQSLFYEDIEIQIYEEE